MDDARAADDLLLATLASANERAAHGALEELFRSRYDRLVRFADAYVRSPEIAEDIVAQLFAWIWERRGELAVRSGLDAYLFAAVRNRAQDHLRRNRIERDWQSDFADSDESPALGEASASLASWADRELERSDAVRALESAVAELPERARVVLWLRWRSGLTAAEIAEATGRTPAAIAMELSRTLDRLRRLLGPLLLCLVLERLC